MNDHPDATYLETERIRLRLWRTDDVDRFLDLYTIWDVARWLGSTPTLLRSREEAVERIERWMARSTEEADRGLWAVERKDDGVVAGTVLLVPVPDGGGAIEVGWHLHPDSWGRGLATESARAVLDRPEQRFVMGYEQALGYLVAGQPLDKDGISAAVLFAEIAASAAADGITLQQWLDDIAARYGRHLLADASVRMPPADAAAKVRALQSAPPSEIGGRAVVATEEYPEADLLRFELEGGVRVQIRPSGTEPKVKLYGEAVVEDPAPYVAALAALLG